VEASLRLQVFFKGMTGTYITELNYTQLSEVGQTVMCGILVHNEGDILHGLGTEPASHLSLVFLVGDTRAKGGRTQQDRSLAIVIDCSTEASAAAYSLALTASQKKQTISGF
jgi:hypothetical protein